MSKGSRLPAAEAGIRRIEMRTGPRYRILQRCFASIATASPTFDKMVSSIQEVAARGAPVVALVNHRDKRLKSLAQDLIAVPEVDEIFSPIVNAAALQLFAYYVAVERGCDVDQPRNLAKSVTVE